MALDDLPPFSPRTLTELLGEYHAHRLQPIIDRPGEERIEPEPELATCKDPRGPRNKGEVQQEPEQNFQRQRESDPAKSRRLHLTVLGRIHLA
jgi:hypothetical protein